MWQFKSVHYTISSDCNATDKRNKVISTNSQRNSEFRQRISSRQKEDICFVPSSIIYDRFVPVRMLDVHTVAWVASPFHHCKHIWFVCFQSGQNTKQNVASGSRNEFVNSNKNSSLELLSKMFSLSRSFFVFFSHTSRRLTPAQSFAFAEM